MTRQSYDPVRTPTVADLLRREGYRTGGFVGTAVLSARTGIDIGFDAYDDLVDPPVADTYAWSLVHDVQARLGGEVRLPARQRPPALVPGLPTPRGRRPGERGALDPRGAASGPGSAW